MYTYSIDHVGGGAAGRGGVGKGEITQAHIHIDNMATHSVVGRQSSLGRRSEAR